jgi:hypothetical protein
MMNSRHYYALVVTLWLSSYCSAYYIHSDCGDSAAKVQKSTDTALRVAKYAVGVATDPNPVRHGQILEDLLGAANENDVVVLANVNSKFEILGFPFFAMN